MNRTTRDKFENLAAAEAAFVGTEFLAPVVRGHGVTVRIAGIRCALSVDPRRFHGWGVFRATSSSNAALRREATAVERRQYLQRLPEVRLIVCETGRRGVTAVAANPAEDRFSLAGTTPLLLCDRVDPFDTVIAQFDGARFWFDRADPRADPATAAFLRRELAAMTDPATLGRAGLTAGQRIAYAVQFVPRVHAILADRHHRADARLAVALAHAGAALADFTETADGYRVSFTVDGRRHTGVVGKGDLTVQSAGICLSGRDRDFDLTSLVGVLRESPF